MEEAVQNLASDSGPLRSIRGHRSAAGYTLLDLTFDRGTLRLTANADTDEIVVQVDAAKPPDSTEIQNDAALASLIGKVITAAWTMINQRGYEDAFQVRCLDLETRRESCCQFEVAAAAITVARVSL
jgi:hypothetical protein